LSEYDRAFLLEQKTMKKPLFCAVVALFIVCSLQQALAQDNTLIETKMIKNCDTLALRVGERKAALNDEVKLGYMRYSHENSSSSPDQPFAATTGVYFFEAIAKDYLEELTIYMGVTQTSSTVNWKHYKVTLLSVSENQSEVVISILDTSIK
jgi:hypothetical protein